MRKLSLIALLAVLTAIGAPLHAEEADPRFRVENRSDAIAEVAGVVCTFCAYGTRKNLERVSAVDHNRLNKGVEFDVRNGVIKLALDAARPIDFVGIHQAIRAGGYQLINLYVYVDGVVEAASDTVLTDVGTGQQFRLVDAQGKSWAPSGQGGGRVAVRGAVPAGVLRELTSIELVPMRVVAVVPDRESSSAPAR